MSGPVFRQALRQVVRPSIIVSLATGAFFYLILLSSSSFVTDIATDPSQAPGFFREPPKAIEAFLGGSADFFSPEGWLAAGMLHPVVLALQTAGALMVAGGAVAAELERGSLELVLSRPVGRGSFLRAKAAAALATVTSVHLGALGGAFLARAFVEGVDGIPVARILLVLAASWLLFAAFAMIAMLISARSSLRGRAVGATVGIVVASFFLNFMALLFDEIRGLRFASPFHYFRPADLLSGEPFAGDLAVLAAVAVGCALLAGRRFARRDLTR